MSRWNHSICSKCWEEKNPNRSAIAIEDPEVHTCCYCKKDTNEGIYVRDDAEALGCEHADPNDSEMKAYRLEDAIREHRHAYLTSFMESGIFDSEGEAIAGASKFNQRLWSIIE